MSKEQMPIKSKLFKLKEWLTIPEAARYLSMMFGEEVNEADILRLALDGHLVLSVNFVNPAFGKCGKLISCEDTENLPPEIHSLLEGLPEEMRETRDKLASGIRKLGVFPNHCLYLDEKVTTIEGVWDLSMLCGQQYLIENEYQKLTGGPVVESPIIGAAYVTREGGQVCRLYKEFEPEFQTDTRVDSDSYYPATAELPPDSILVVRTRAILDLLEELSQKKAKKEKPLDHRLERTYLNIIGAFLEITTGTFKDESFSSETQLRDFIAEKFDDLRGVSGRNTADIFAKAKKALNGELD